MTPRRILLAGWLGFLLYAYPGFLQSDGGDQLVDSRYGAFTDWHSPVMTEIWRIVGFVISGPAGMLFLQSLLLLLGSYYLVRRVLADRHAAIAAVALLLFPPILATGAVICAESQLVAFLVAGAAAFTSESFRTRLAGFGLLLLASAVRDGAAAATLPIFIAGFRWRTQLPGWRRPMVAVASWLVATLLGIGISYALVDDRTEREEMSSAMADIVGTLRYASTISDAELTKQLTGVPLAVTTGIQKQARAVYGKELFYDAKEQRVFDPPQTEAEREALYTGRRAVVLGSPLGYLTHRWHYFYRVIGLPPSKPWSAVYAEFVASPMQETAISHTAHHSAIQSRLVGTVEALGETFWFRPYLYLLIALALVPLAVTRKHHEATVFLASGLAYMLALLFVANRVDQRDSHWLIVSTVLSTILLIARRAKRNDGSAVISPP